MRCYLFCGLILFIVCCKSKPTFRSKLIGEPIPEFSILLPDSLTWYSTSNIQKGKYKVIFYFSPGCPYCKLQMEDIVSNMDRLKDFHFLVVATRSFEGMKDFYQSYSLAKFPNIVTGLDTSGTFFKYFNASVVPYNAIYGRDGRLKVAQKGKLKSTDFLIAAEQ